MSAVDKHVRKKGKVDAGWASRFQSDRFLNSDEMICMVPNNTDVLGRNSDVNSIQTKAGGCNSALDRVLVENDIRANSYSLPGLSSYGIVDSGVCTGSGNLAQNQPLQAMSMTWTSSGITKDTLVRPDTQAYLEFERNKEAQWVYMGQKMLHYLSHSGCL